MKNNIQIFRQNLSVEILEYNKKKYKLQKMFESTSHSKFIFTTPEFLNVWSSIFVRVQVNPPSNVCMTKGVCFWLV